MLILIENLGTKLNKTGKKQSWGKYSCSFCLSEIERRLGLDKVYQSCGCKRKDLQSEAKKGIKHPFFGKRGELSANWQNGKSFELYPPEFNKELKQLILERDIYTCQDPNCEHKTVLLVIHHIDYVKKNNFEYNLITLCNSCHVKTNGNREYWKKFYQEKNKSFFLLFLKKFSINFEEDWR